MLAFPRHVLLRAMTRTSLAATLASCAAAIAKISAARLQPGRLTPDDDYGMHPPQGAEQYQYADHESSRLGNRGKFIPSLRNVDSAGNLTPSIVN